MARKKLKDHLKGIAKFLEYWDWLWSIPLMIFLYWFTGFLFGNILGLAVGSFDLSFVQPLFLSILIYIGGCVTFLYTIRFVLDKVLHKYLYKGAPIDFTLDITKLEPWQRVVLILFVFSFSVYSVAKIFLAIL